MSYDFELYTSRRITLDPLRTGAESNVVVDGPDILHDDDIPQEYLPHVGKKRVLYRIHLEGDLTAINRVALDNWLRGLVVETKGVLIDLQTNGFETVRKRGEIASSQAAADDFGRMSFYFTDGESFYENGFEQMLKCIAETMPEAFPKRYGSYEPLQLTVDARDNADLIAAFHDDPEIIIKSQTPFSHMYLSIPCHKTFERYHPRHFVRREFMVGHVEFELRPKIFSDPAMFSKLESLFEKICILLDVIYAEISTEDHRGSSWRWYGLPDTEPDSLCIGPAYQEVWPEFLDCGQKIGLHHRLVSKDRFGNTPPRPAAELIAPAQTGMNPDEKPNYAPVFPFDYNFDPDTYIW